MISIKRKQQFQKWLTKTATEEKDLAFIAFHALHKFIMMRRKEQQDATIRRMSRVPIVGKVIASIWMQRDASRAQEGGARLRQGVHSARLALLVALDRESRDSRVRLVGLSVEQTTGRRGNITTRFMSNFRSKRSGVRHLAELHRDEYFGGAPPRRARAGTPPPSAPPRRGPPRGRRRPDRRCASAARSEATPARRPPDEPPPTRRGRRRGRSADITYDFSTKSL